MSMEKTRSTVPRNGSHRRARIAALIRVCAWAYLVVLLSLWSLLAWASDKCWPATLLRYGPRWLLALPLLLLVPAALVVRRRSLALLAGAGAVAIFPIMGFCVPWRGLMASPPDGWRVRVLTCNVFQRHHDEDRLAALVAEIRPDVVALQKWPDEKPPRFVTEEPGWHVCSDKGLLLASRFPRTSGPVLNDRHGWHAVIARHDLEGPAGPIHFFVVHLLTPRRGLQAMLSERWRGVGQLEANCAERRSESLAARQLVDGVAGPVLIAGDFNLPTDSSIYQESWSDFNNAFSQAGWGLGHTFFTRRIGIRIDHVLASPGWRVGDCRVGPDIGSDHRPVIADLHWIGQN
jgi:vancomycin resistance protein VanJ